MYYITYDLPNIEHCFKTDARVQRKTALAVTGATKGTSQIKCD